MRKGEIDMTKAEELKILEKIAGLIAESGKDSYISMTFAGICDVCRRNITDDFGDSPVEDCANMRVALDAERRMHDETKWMLSESNDAWKKAMNECEYLNSQLRNMGQEAADLAEERDAMSDCVNGLQEICDKQDAEIRRLKAEIVKLRMERMTEEQVAELYEKM